MSIDPITMRCGGNCERQGAKAIERGGTTFTESEG